MSLSNKFTQERRKINYQIRDERVIAHCHTTINKIEDDVKEFIKKRDELLQDYLEGKISLIVFLERKDELAGDKLK